MNRIGPLFLSLALLTVAVLACTCSTSAKKLAPTEVPTPVGPSLGDTRTRPTDGMVMVYVPAGEFQMGSTVHKAKEHTILRTTDERPVHTVALDGFWIDKYEVTNGQYALCVAEGACSPPTESGSYTRDSYYGNSAYDDYPVINVSWLQAVSYCSWVGGRLPTEAEWEYAARGPEGRIYPWGNSFDGTWLNYCDVNCYVRNWSDASFDDGYADTAPVGSYPAGVSWCGALDMAGNVFEWTADWYGEYPSGRQDNPTGPSSGTNRVVRGGAWALYRHFARCASRHKDPPVTNVYSIGFRCVSPVGSGP